MALGKGGSRLDDVPVDINSRVSCSNAHTLGIEVSVDPGTNIIVSHVSADTIPELQSAYQFPREGI